MSSVRGNLIERQTALRLLVGVLLSALLVGCQTLPQSQSSRTLNADEVRRLFSGKTVESYNLTIRMTTFTYYDPAGRLVQERLWANRRGSWKVQPDGKICLQLGKSEASCRHIIKVGDRYYKVRADKAGKQERIIRYRHFAEGNKFGKG